MQLEIKKAKPQHAEEMMSVRVIAAMDVYVNKEYGISAEDIIAQYGPEEIDKLKQGLKEGRIRGWIVVDSQTEEIIGCSTAKLKKDKIRFATLHVLPEYHGEGVGREIVKQMLEWAEPKKKDIFLYVVKYNKDKYEWYKRLGFEEITEGEWKLKAGKIIPRVKMVKHAS
ncbi:MAG: GNAT family N-acetyltransferase [Candidatus Spechtbacterales bacterium]|nr:GNAT family N-acetyltransferase [Candidatus Spechtbacterales bacterium]